MVSRKNKIIISCVVIVLLIIPLSGLFTINDYHLYFKPYTKIEPYQAGTYENYTITNNCIANYSTSGYLTIMSSKTNVSLNMCMHYKYTHNGNTHTSKIITKKVFIKDGNNLYYNNSPVILPFFLNSQNNTITEYEGHMENYTASNVTSNVMDNSPGLDRCHYPSMIIYVTTHRDGYTGLSKYIYSMHSHLLANFANICNPLISNITGAYCNHNISDPMGFNFLLHKTNVVTFPPDFIFAGAVLFLVFYTEAYFITVPATIIIVLLSYNDHRKKKRRRNE